MIRVLLAAAFFLAAEALAEPPKTAPQPPLERIAAPVDAATLAATDLNSYASNEQKFIRYVWIPPWVSNGYAIASQFLNEVVSRNSVIVPAALVSRNDVHLIRVDFRQYAPDPRDQRDLIQVWERLESVYFPFKSAAVDVFGKEFEVRFRYTNGKTFTKRCALVALEGDTAFVRYSAKYPLHSVKKSQVIGLNDFNAVTLQNRQLAHLGTTGQLLPDLTGSAVPIIRLDVLLRQGYTSIDTNQFKGLYYDFMGMSAVTKGSLYSFLGANPRKTNTTKIALIKSQVTGKPRIVEYFYGNRVRPQSGTGLIAETYDTNDEHRGINWQDDIQRFIDTAVASEVIFERANGTHGYAIFANQQLVDSAPDVVAANRKIPQPHTTSLAAGIGCIYCHSRPHGTSGWIRAHNDLKDQLEFSSEFRAFIEQQELLGAFDSIQGVKRVLSFRQRLGDVFRDDFQRVEEFAAQFFTDDINPAQKGQLDYERAIRQATFVDVEVAGQAILSMWDHYEYDLVTPYVALRDIGFTTDGDPVLGLQKVMGVPVGYEDPVFSALKIGKPTDRGTWERKYPLVAERTVNALLLKD